MRLTSLIIALLLLLPLTLTFAEYQHSIQVTVDGLTYQCNNSGSPTNRFIEFYKSDSCSSNLLASLQFGSNPMENEEKCRRTDKFIDSNVWGIRINMGECINIDDDDFLSICMRFQ